LAFKIEHIQQKGNSEIILVPAAADTAPQGFRDVILSKKWSWLEPYEYPLEKPFRGDARYWPEYAITGDQVELNTYRKLYVRKQCDGVNCACKGTKCAYDLMANNPTQVDWYVKKNVANKVMGQAGSGLKFKVNGF
jgi:hypothetical protein